MLILTVSKETKIVFCGNSCKAVGSGNISIAVWFRISFNFIKAMHNLLGTNLVMNINILLVGKKISIMHILQLSFLLSLIKCAIMAHSCINFRMYNYKPAGTIKRNLTGHRFVILIHQDILFITK